MNKHIKTFLLVFALALVLLKVIVINSGLITSGSMLPTIQLEDRLMIDKVFIKSSNIKRGDVIIFNLPESIDFYSDSAVVKRVIGLPGEIIAVKDGKVYINNKPLDENYLYEEPDYVFEPIKIPEDCFFVLGDNRNDSYDSHFWGVLSSKNVIGRVLFRYWPLKEFGSLD